MAKVDQFFEAIKFIIDNCSFGFLKEIDKHLHKINGEWIRQNEVEYTELLRTAEENVFRQVPYGETSAIVSPFNKKGLDYYCQTPTEHFKFQVNPLSENLSELQKVEKTNPIRDKLNKAIGDYVNKYYPSLILKDIIRELKIEKEKNESKTSYNSQYSSNSRRDFLEKNNDFEKTSYYVNCDYFGGGKMEAYIIISSHHCLFSANNQTAMWIAMYKLISEGKKEYKISGFVRIENFFYENLNNSHFNVDENLNLKEFTAANDDDLCKEVVKTIEDFENDIEKRIYELFDNFSEDIMKNLRRNVTVTGNKMNWNIENPSFSSLKD